jgi:hypothetical protein
MASVNIRQLRDTRQLKAWLQAGKTVELRGRERVIALAQMEEALASSGQAFSRNGWRFESPLPKWH